MVESVLASATKLVIERGSAVTMSEIARDSGVALASLYQYFSDRSAILRALLERHYEEVRALLASTIEGSTSVATFVANIEAGSIFYFDLHRDDPFSRSIWSIIQTDADLQALDVADTLTNAALMHRVALPLYGKVDSEALMATCALSLQMASTAARFAIVVPEPLPGPMRASYLQMIRAAFMSLKQG